MNFKKKDTSSLTGTQKPERKFSFANISDTFHNETFLFTGGAILTVIAIFILGAYISFLFNGGIDQSVVDSGIGEIGNKTGGLGARLAERLVNKWFGFSAFFIPVFMTVCGLNMMRITHFKIGRWFVSCTFLMVWLSVFLHLTLLGVNRSGLMENSFIYPGGTHGINVTDFLCSNIGIWGLLLLLILTMLLYCVYMTRRTIEVIRGGANRMKQGMRRHEKAPETDTNVQDKTTDNDSTDTHDPDADIADIVDDVDDNPYAATADITSTEKEPEPTEEPKTEKPAPHAEEIKMTITAAEGDQKAEGKIQEAYDPRLDLSHYKFPTLDLLKHYDNDAPAIDEKEQEANKHRIIQVLRDFGIEIDTINATVGPTITLYEITPAAGVYVYLQTGLLYV